MRPCSFEASERYDSPRLEQSSWAPDAGAPGPICLRSSVAFMAARSMAIGLEMKLHMALARRGGKHRRWPVPVCHSLPYAVMCRHGSRAASTGASSAAGVSDQHASNPFPSGHISRAQGSVGDRGHQRLEYTIADSIKYCFRLSAIVSYMEQPRAAFGRASSISTSAAAVLAVEVRRGAGLSASEFGRASH